MEEEVITPQEVTVIQPGRDPVTGKFLKGNKLRPPGPLGGHPPKKLDSRPILEAIHNEFTVEEIRLMLREAYNTAVKMEDWKGQMAVVQFVAYYAIGKPVQRSIKATIEPEDFARIFKLGGEEAAQSDGD